ncbi:MAG: serine hydrolase [Oscillospiraceae bacterium]|nr:serine hydrolase [Oscillospiraceae bacterium]
MKSKKPDLYLGITLCMLVLAAVLCIVILLSNSGKKTKPTESASSSSETTTQSSDGSETTAPSDSGTASTAGTETGTGSTEPAQPVNLPAIDEAGLKAALDDSLSGLSSEWQVVVMDPAKESKVASAVNCDPDSWMTANRMTQVFIMGTVFQQAKDGTITLENVIEDVKSMIVENDYAAADRLTEMLGAGDAEKGREAVKTFAVDSGVKLGFNRPLNGNAEKKNYVTAQQTATLLNLLCSGKLVSEAASQQMLEILMTKREDELDPGLTTENAQWGFITDVEDDVCICTMGVVKLPNRSFVISVVCNKPITTDGAKKKAAELIGVAERFFSK